jgi:ribose 1,5-bisphosphokinase
MSGRLVLVVGPSGAGKDSVIAAAAGSLAGDASVVFALRAITRPADAGGEAHEPITWQAFEESCRTGDFLLHWRANGLGYGIPARYGTDLAAGRTLVANVSRTVIGAAAARFSTVHVVSVSASPEVLARRLAARARETAEEIASRLRRAALELPANVPVTTILNDGALENAAAALVRVLGRACSGASG